MPTTTAGPPHVRGVDAHGVEAVQQEAERPAKRLRTILLPLLLGGRQHAHPHPTPLRLGLVGARGRLDPPNDRHDVADKTNGGVPVVGAGAHLLPKKVDVDDLTNLDKVLAPLAKEMTNAVADLGEHTERANVARRLAAHVVGDAVPEGLRGHRAM